MVFYQLAGLLAAIWGFHAAVPTPETSLGADRIAPLDLARLVIASERQWHITLFDDQVLACRTLGDLAAHIEGLLADALDDRPEVTDDDRLAWYYE